MHTTAIADSGYRNLPLSILDESSTNPRRTFEPTKLVKLAHSLTVHTQRGFAELWGRDLTEQGFLRGYTG